jgi:DtxR family Mn-dependent transcriptional regulator
LDILVQKSKEQCFALKVRALALLFTGAFYFIKLTVTFIYKLGIPNFMIKQTKEDYLRVIYHLQEEQDNINVNSVDISKYLNISKASVSEMIRKLIKEKLISSKSYGKIHLTKKGLSYAVKTTRKHRIIEVFLSEILKIKGNLVHEEAHRLEHAFSDNSIGAIAVLIKDKKSCPHGKPIPGVEI